MLEEEVEILGVPEIPSKQTVAKGQLLNITSNNVTYFTHIIHKYPAKFIPHIPRWAINKYLRGKGKLVLDPFCGSGTTLVEASKIFVYCPSRDVRNKFCRIFMYNMGKISNIITCNVK